jgi:hypothetical protein
MSKAYLDEFLAAYVECALWSSTDNADDSGGEPLDANYGAEDIAPETLAEMREDCADFIELTSMYTRTNWTAEQAGHDFWLTRNGHGAGFWDRGEPDGDELTKYAKTYGGVDLYVGDDGTIYT